jgi:hypothetical protein
MDWTNWKVRTEVLVPWITAMGLLVGAGYTMFQYAAHKKDQRIQQALSYASEWRAVPLRDTHRRLDDAWQRNAPRILGTLDAEAEPDPIARHDKYSMAVAQMIEGERLQGDLLEVISFYEDAAVCVEKLLCDDDTIRAFFGEAGRALFRQHYSYICSLRAAYSNATLAGRLETFFNARPLGDACK